MSVTQLDFGRRQYICGLGEWFDPCRGEQLFLDPSADQIIRAAEIIGSRLMGELVEMTHEKRQEDIDDRVDLSRTEEAVLLYMRDPEWDSLKKNLFLEPGHESIRSEERLMSLRLARFEARLVEVVPVESEGNIIFL